jgi:hypothetical protein
MIRHLISQAYAKETDMARVMGGPGLEGTQDTNPSALEGFPMDIPTSSIDENPGFSVNDIDQGPDIEANITSPSDIETRGGGNWPGGAPMTKASGAKYGG